MIVQAEFLRLQHPCGYCGTRIRDVLPLELSPVCDWFPLRLKAQSRQLAQCNGPTIRLHQILPLHSFQLVFSLLHKKLFSFGSTDEDIHRQRHLKILYTDTL